MHISLAVLLSLVSYFLGDWKNIRTYGLTIMYVIICDLLYNFLCQHKLLWVYKPDILPNYHIFVDLTHSFINLPLLTLLYLSRYPYADRISKQSIYIAKWVVGSFLVELIFLHFHRIELQYEYKTWMEIPFYSVMYVMLRLHHTRPALTYLLSIVIIVFLMIMFEIPIKN
ncbi:CBO0543 family protein [Bacillus sp. Marseille-P3661]|uniref:CBO0543 family protein n=1 Tax=Bacillus sp. Marseille-P3661 TaxID=1936234 RepID=UPI00115AE9AE|nr:CBO0543 family protein [Bacillus sp. Marseille-P3661]